MKFQQDETQEMSKLIRRDATKLFVFWEVGEKIRLLWDEVRRGLDGHVFRDVRRKGPTADENKGDNNEADINLRTQTSDAWQERILRSFIGDFQFVACSR